MRSLYSLLLYLATPLVLLYLLLRSLRDPGYRRRWGERFGFIAPPARRHGIVIHSASMGEVNAAAVLMKQLRKAYPGEAFCVTTLTPTGSRRVRELFRDEVDHVYVPFDLPGATRRFFERLQPRLLIVMETEIWPNFYHAAARKGIPIAIANARISQRSIGAYRRLRRLTAEALQHVGVIAAQSEADAARMVEIGADERRIVVTGNLKYDLQVPPSLAEQGEAVRVAWGSHRPVLLAGSTHEGDEGPVLEAFGRLLSDYPAALLVLVPRHPERFGRAAQAARNTGLRVALRSAGMNCPPTAQCFVVDSMGELSCFYAACDVAFVGGSLEAIGGHNVLEPAALARPVLVGPHTFNFEDITRQLIEHGAARRVSDERELEQQVRRLFADPELRDRMGRAGRELVHSGQGAARKTLDALAPSLTATGR